MVILKMTLHLILTSKLTKISNIMLGEKNCDISNFTKGMKIFKMLKFDFAHFFSSYLVRFLLRPDIICKDELIAIGDENKPTIQIQSF